MTNSHRLAIRCDGGTGVLGLGHLSRCVALAVAYTALGHEATFFCKELDGSGIRWLRAQNVDVVSLPDNASDLEVAFMLLDATPDCVLVDHYKHGATLFEAIWGDGTPILAIVDTDMPARRLVDGVICMHPGAEDVRLRIPATAARLLGSTFALFRPELIAASSVPWIPPAETTLFVSFGASDVGNLTQDVVQQLADAQFDGRIICVVGAPWPAERVETLKDFVAQLPIRAVVIQNPPNLTSIMRGSTLAITQASTMAYELCLLGVPTVCTEVTPDQAKVASGLESSQAAVVCSAGALGAKALELLEDDPARLALSEKAAMLFDGRGAARVAAQLAGTSIAVRLRETPRGRHEIYRGRSRIGGCHLAIDGRTAVISVDVEPDSEGQAAGIGAVHLLCEMASDAGVEVIHARVHRDEKQELAIYQRVGFGAPVWHDEPGGSGIWELTRVLQ